MDVLAFSPVQNKEGDEILMEKTGLIRWYDDEHDTVEKTEGADDAFFEYTPNARVRPEWRHNPKEVLPCEEGSEYYKEHESQISAEIEEARQRERIDNITNGI